MVGTMVVGIMGLRSPSNFHRSLLLSSLIATGCGDQGASPFWAFQHASVQEIDGVLTGYQVWEFYGKRWQRKQKEKHHICALVQSVSGTPDTLADCPDCETVFAVDLSVVETDCDGAINPVDFEGVTHFGFGLAPPADQCRMPAPCSCPSPCLLFSGPSQPNHAPRVQI